MYCPVLYYIGIYDLHRLSQSLQFRPKTAYLAVLFFNLNPSSIFMSSIYTESLFALLSFTGMLFFSRKELFKSCFVFSLASCVRSNGILYSGFFLWEFIHVFPESNRKLTEILKTALYMCFTLAPFVLFQFYAYNQFCYNFPLRPWCEATIPFIYSFVQSHYW